MQVTEMFGMIVKMLMIGTVLVTLMRYGFMTRNRRLASRVQLEMFNRLTDRMGSSPEMLEWLKTEAGQKLWLPTEDGLPKNAAAPVTPHSRVLNAVQGGLLLTFVSTGVLVVNQVPAWIPRFEETRMGLLYIGVIGLTAGLGLLASAGASWWLSKNWGLIQSRKDGE
jgi:hypothetical protein